MTHTETVQDPKTDGSAAISQIQLASIVLSQCSAVRAPAVHPEPGDVNGDIEVNHSQAGSLLSYSVKGTYRFTNTAGEALANISVTFDAIYELPTEEALSNSDIDAFAESVIFQVTPFQREILATLTNRLAIAPFFIPLVRLSDLQKHQEDSADA